MKTLLSFQDFLIDIKRTIVDMDTTLYVVLLALFSILLLAMFRFIVKHAFNKNVIKRNIALPVFFSMVVFALLIVLVTMRSGTL